MQYGVSNALVMQAARVLGARVVGVTPVIYDSFTAPDGTLITAHTPDICPIGSAWLHVGGATVPTIQSQKLLAPTAIFTDVIESNKADATISMVADYNSSNGTVRGIVARCVDNTHFWILRHFAGNMNIIEVNGSSTIRASLAYAPPNGIETLIATLSGNILTLTIGANTISYTSALFNTATKHGLRAGSFVTGPINITIDDFTVTSP